MRRAGLRWRQIGAALGCHKATALRLAREYEPAPSSNGQAPTRPTDGLAPREYQTPVPTL